MTEPRRPGRPATGKTPPLNVRVAQHVQDAARAKAEQLDRPFAAEVTRLLAEYADQRIHDVEEAHGEALLDDVYHDWPGEPGLDPTDNVYDLATWLRTQIEADASLAARQADAKLQILSEYRRLSHPDPLRRGASWDGRREALEFVVRSLALPYADRPGYRGEWKP